MFTIISLKDAKCLYFFKVKWKKYLESTSSTTHHGAEETHVIFL